MFEHIAPRYDDFTRIFSFGMDSGWKAALLGWLEGQQPVPTTILDVACGTGDLAFGAAVRYPAAAVLGLDVAERMIAAANERRRTPDDGRPRFAVGDLTDTRLPNASMDAVLAGYALRNVPRLDDGLREAARLLRPGGVLYTLDFYRPATRGWRTVFLAYLRTAGALFGWWWHRAPVMYAYIAGSIDAFVDIGAFEAALDRHGFDVSHRQTHLGGGVALHAARRR